MIKSPKNNSTLLMCLNSHVNSFVINVVYLLNEVEVKNDSLVKNSERIARMQLDFSKLLADNEELIKKIELIEDENYHFKNKIEEAETYIS